MLNELGKFPYSAIFTCTVKKNSRFLQNDKERAYINSISRIVSSCNCEIDVVFDRFRINSFEKNIVKKLLSFENVKSARPAESQKEFGIQFVDNLCSSIRLYKTNNDKYSFYKLIEDRVKEV